MRSQTAKAGYISLDIALIVFFLAMRQRESTAQPMPVATGKSTIGTLLVIHTDGIEDRLRGEGALQIFEGDILSTETNALALVVLRDGTQVALNENTTIKILNRWEKSKGNLPIVRMKEGELWLKTPRAPTPVELETPVAGQPKGSSLPFKGRGVGPCNLANPSGCRIKAQIFIS